VTTWSGGEGKQEPDESRRHLACYAAWWVGLYCIPGGLDCIVCKLVNMQTPSLYLLNCVEDQIMNRISFSNVSGDQGFFLVSRYETIGLSELA
jgi:hypothetical protein